MDEGHAPVPGTPRPSQVALFEGEQACPGSEERALMAVSARS
jgi:hypothetical protein